MDLYQTGYLNIFLAFFYVVCQDMLPFPLLRPYIQMNVIYEQTPEMLMKVFYQHEFPFIFMLDKFDRDFKLSHFTFFLP